MGSLVYSEVVHDTAHHPFSSSLLESATNRARRQSNETSYRPISQRSASQHNRPSSSTTRSASHARSIPAAPSSSSSTSSSSSASASQNQPRDASAALPREMTEAREQQQQPQQSTTSSSSASEGPSSPNLGPTSDPARADALPDAAASAQAGNADQPPTPPTNRVKVKDLQHIANCVNEETGGLGLSRSISDSSSEELDDPEDTQYEISSMPISDVIEMVAGLLTKITSTNDRQHEHLHRSIPPLDGSAPLSNQTSSVLSFHGKNVPSITIMSYLSRIHKYCPTTYEVFISLLVYFDRMTERVNAGPLQSLRRSRERLAERPRTLEHARGPTSSHSDSTTSLLRQQASETSTPPSSAHATPEQKFTDSRTGSSQELPSPPLSDSDPYSLTSFFVVDSFNIHRLIIAGVTCASKFFSDIFYTNSRYAKVGGLPLAELNHLEIQFLILNEFRLSVPAEELEAYGTMLVKFYAREVLSNRRQESMEDVTST